MHRLRTSSRLIRFVLAWFALALGAAVLSPVVHPKSMQLVCTAGGVKLIAVDGEGAAGKAHVGQHTLDCPLCLSLHAPPPAAHASPASAVPPMQVPRLRPAAAPASLTGAPLPARGPPLPV